MTPPLLRHKQLAYAAVIIDRGDFTLGLTQLNQPGYWLTPQHGVFNSYNEAAAKAHSLNLALGLSAEKAALIVASSMRAQNGKPSRQPNAAIRPFLKNRRPAR